MAWAIAIVYDDGQEIDNPVVHFDLDDATRVALDLADYMGRNPPVDGHGRPRSVRVKRGGRTEISIRIFPGGLKPDRLNPSER